VARNNIGVVVTTGMFIGTLFTLFVVPSIYLFIASDKRKSPDEPANRGAHPEAKPLNGNGAHASGLEKEPVLSR
jgi:hypothetical protein